MAGLETISFSFLTVAQGPPDENGMDAGSAVLESPLTKNLMLTELMDVKSGG